MNIHQQAVIDCAVEWKRTRMLDDHEEYGSAAVERYKASDALYEAVTRMQSAAPDSLGERVQKAQEEVRSWTPERVANARLEGGRAADANETAEVDPLHNALHICRNPYGWPVDTVRAARLAVCDAYEQVLRAVQLIASAGHITEAREIARAALAVSTES